MDIPNGPRRPEVYTPARWSVLPPPRPRQPTITAELGLVRIVWPALEFRLSRETGNLAGDWARARTALLAARTPDQYAAVRLRFESLTARQRAAEGEMRGSLVAAFEPVGKALSELGKVAAEAMQRIGELIRDAARAEAVSPDPRARALAAHRNRTTGPKQQGRAPRSIGRASTGARR